MVAPFLTSFRPRPLVAAVATIHGPFSLATLPLDFTHELKWFRPPYWRR